MTPDEIDAQWRTALLLRGDGHAEEAASVLHGLLRLLPTSVPLWREFGAALTDMRRYQDGFTAYQTALEFAPDDAETHIYMGNSLMLTFAFEAAEEKLRHALTLNPKSALGLANLADCLLAQRKTAEALHTYRMALALAPSHPSIHMHYAHALLITGDLLHGFQEYEWRWKNKPFLPDPKQAPLAHWDGENLDGRTIRIFAEQGFGDTLQFIRYAPLIAGSGGILRLLVRKELARLLKTAPNVDEIEIIPENQAFHPGYNCDLGLMSLPRIAKTTQETIPAPIPYLFADPFEAGRWKKRLSSLPGLKVGLVWAGEPRPEQFENHFIDQWRSIPLLAFAPFAALSGISFVSLQKGDAAKQTPPEGLELSSFMDEIGDFADSAALIEALDLVITVDTSVAHLAGALGKEVWILSRFDGCWRWFLENERSPWYPNARIFRQTKRGFWSETIDSVTIELKKRL